MTAVCKHGALHYCGSCEAEKAQKCKHGKPYYCGFCGTVSAKPQSAPAPAAEPAPNNV